jgi:hypothetical protein
VRDILVLFVHVIVTLVRLLRPGGLRSVLAESALVRHQLLILNPVMPVARRVWLPIFVAFDTNAMIQTLCFSACTESLIVHSQQNNAGRKSTPQTPKVES